MAKKFQPHARQLVRRTATQEVTAPVVAPNNCKLTPVSGPPSYQFRVKAADMPVSFLLDSPDKQTELLGVEVYKDADAKNPLQGQPTAFSTTGFTLNLAPGNYAVTVEVGALTTAKPVYITEACSGATKLDWIVSSVNTSGEFGLQVES
jgi:hypothetical protein